VRPRKQFLPLNITSTIPYYLTRSLPSSHVYDTAVCFESPMSHILIIYKCTSYQLFVQLIVVDYPHMCFICVQVNMCDTLHKRKTCCKKDMDHSEGFSNLTVVANVLIGCDYKIKSGRRTNIFTNAIISDVSLSSANGPT